MLNIRVLDSKKKDIDLLFLFNIKKVMIDEKRDEIDR
jgi:hypothetical protein